MAYSSKIKIIYLGFVIATTQYSCTEDYSNRETIYINQETKDFIYFKPGTWWLYKNLKTNINDTWKISNRINKIIPPGKTNPYNIENIILSVNTAVYDTFNFDVENNEIIFITKKFNGLNQICYYNNNNINKYGACDNNYIRLLSSDSLDGKCIRLEFDIYPFPCTNFFPKYFVWERHKGLVKMSYPNGDTLVLIEENIIQ